MKFYRISIPQYGKTLTAEEGRVLQQVLRDQGIRLDAPCGGKGTCKNVRSS